MITQLNLQSNSWTRIYEIDLHNPLPDQELKDYFVMQLDQIVSQQYQAGYYLRAITTFDGRKPILVFTPQHKEAFR